MNLFQSLILAIVQGVTEFLPISSTGHLHLVQHFLHITPSLTFDIFLNTASLMSVLFFFRRQTVYFFQNLKYIIVGTLPAVFFGLFFKDKIESIFADNSYLPIQFIITGITLLSLRFLTYRDRELSFLKAFLIGIGQSIAILPAISRSGATIFTALILGLSPLNAFNFSFSLFIPASLGALVLDLKDLSSFSFFTPTYLFSFLVTFIVGVVALYFLQKVLISRYFWMFGIYTALLGICLFFVF